MKDNECNENLMVIFHMDKRKFNGSKMKDRGLKVWWCFMCRIKEWVLIEIMNV